MYLLDRVQLVERDSRPALEVNLQFKVSSASCLVAKTVVPVASGLPSITEIKETRMASAEGLEHNKQLVHKIV